MNVERSYRERHEQVLLPLAYQLQTELSDWLDGEPRIDRVSARAKSVDRFLAKSEKVEDGKIKYADPLNDIQDQVGARIVVFYECDVDRVAELVRKYLRPIEFKSMYPENQWTFGYFGRHYIYLFPTHIIEDERFAGKDMPHYFELQIKTLFQHAWSEANHDLGYKPGEQELDPEDARHLAFASAQAWGADKTFSTLFQKRNGANKER